MTDLETRVVKMLRAAPLTASQIAERTGRRQSSIHEVLHRLAVRGVVQSPSQNERDRLWKIKAAS